MENENIMPCSTASFDDKERFITRKKKRRIVLWTNNESKELLQLYYENIGQIGPFAIFKNKTCMWEFISNEISKKYGTFRSPLQCEYRYKNMLKRRNAAKKNNKRSGSEKCDINFEEEFELINSIDDSMEPDVCFGIGQHTIKKRKIDALSSEEEIERKVQKSPNVLAVLRDIQNEKEKEKERRHKKKIEILRELFSRNNK
ncbi:hypothetical protein CAJAP_08396 [Camponotus japonicus]